MFSPYYVKSKFGGTPEVTSSQSLKNSPIFIRYNFFIFYQGYFFP